VGLALSLFHPTILVEPMNQSSPIQPPDRQRVDEQIAASIADAILDGAFEPGSTLPAPSGNWLNSSASTAPRCGRVLARLQRWV